MCLRVELQTVLILHIVCNSRHGSINVSALFKCIDHFRLARDICCKLRLLLRVVTAHHYIPRRSPEHMTYITCMRRNILHIRVSTGHSSRIRSDTVETAMDTAVRRLCCKLRQLFHKCTYKGSKASAFQHLLHYRHMRDLLKSFLVSLSVFA